jgi:hypothetical protein
MNCSVGGKKSGPGCREVKTEPIRTRADYRTTLAEIETLMHAKSGTPEGERLDVLASAVDACQRPRADRTNMRAKLSSPLSNIRSPHAGRNLAPALDDKESKTIMPLEEYSPEDRALAQALARRGGNNAGDQKSLDSALARSPQPGRVSHTRRR